jgi:hypothetical protein
MEPLLQRGQNFILSLNMDAFCMNLNFCKAKNRGRPHPLTPSPQWRWGTNHEKNKGSEHRGSEHRGSEHPK